MNGARDRYLSSVGADVGDTCVGDGLFVEGFDGVVDGDPGSLTPDELPGQPATDCLGRSVGVQSQGEEVEIVVGEAVVGEGSTCCVADVVEGPREGDDEGLAIELETFRAKSMRRQRLNTFVNVADFVGCLCELCDSC